MSFTRIRALPFLPLLALMATAFCASARADSYAEVEQLVRDGKTALALSAAQDHVAAHPKDPQMRFLLGVLQSGSGAKEQALQTFTRLTQDYPELPEPYNNMAVLLAAQRRFEPAREALEMALRVKPDYAIAHENLGDVYAALAAQAYGKAIEFDAAHSTAAPKLALLRQLLSAKIQPPQVP